MFFVRFVIICKDAVNDFLDKNCPYLSAAISFYALFSLFPLILALISVSGYIYQSPSRETQLAEDISQLVPISTTFVEDTIRGVVNARHITGVAGIFGLFWAATVVFGAIRKGVNSAWGIRRPRPFFYERLIDFLLALGAGFLFMVSVSLSGVLGFFREITEVLSSNGGFDGAFIWDRVAQLIPALITFLIFLLLYRYLPNTKVRFREVWWAALLAAIAFEVTKMGFVWYVKTVPVYNVVYGTVGTVVALLTWVYISAIIFLFGALVTSRYAAYLASKKVEEFGIQDLVSELTHVRLKVASSEERR